MNWQDETRKMIRDSKLTTVEIAEGAGVSIHWLNSFRKSSAPKNPGVEQIQAVYEFLKNQ